MNTMQTDTTERTTALLPPSAPASDDARMATALRQLAFDLQSGRLDDTTKTFIAGALRALVSETSEDA